MEIDKEIKKIFLLTVAFNMIILIFYILFVTWKNG